jgi:cytochrome b
MMERPAAIAKGASGRLLVWDLPLRLFHWFLVALIGFSWWSGKHHEMDWHRLSGYAILDLLIFRIYWGFLGGHTARFNNFVRGPGAVIAYGRALLRRASVVARGHNPAGGWSVVLMLGALVAMVAAGLFAVDVDGLESGPLADFLTFDQGRFAAHVHAILFNLILGLMAMHMLAIAFYGVVLRNNLVGPMFSGRALAADTEVDSSWSWRKALIGILVAGSLTYLVAHSFSF